MKIRTVRIRNFRIFTETQIQPEEGLNWIVGSNAQGKTSVLEAIHIGSNLRSFRGHRSVDWIKKGTNLGCVDVYLKDWDTHLSVRLEKNESTGRIHRTAEINSQLIGRSSDYLTKRLRLAGTGYHSISFCPQDHELIRGDPAGRRAYLDYTIAAEDRDYLQIVKQYQRALEHRNALLKAGTPSGASELEIFTEQLVQYGSMMTRQRMEWIWSAALELRSILIETAPEQLDLNLGYASDWAIYDPNFSFSNKSLDGIHFTGQSPIPSLETLNRLFFERLVSQGPQERRVQATLTGPHRDDMKFYLGDAELKAHGSQGEVRSVLLALKLAEIRLFQKKTGLNPILLLDDFSSELDRTRRRHLLNFVEESGLQTFITTTEELSGVQGRKFKVSNGMVSEELKDNGFGNHTVGQREFVFSTEHQNS